MQNYYSFHKIDDRDNIPFCATEYSKFKFGDKDIARKYGKELAEGFVKNNYWGDVLPSTQIVVCSSPYCFIPTATFAMKDYFVQHLNHFLIGQGLKPVEEAKIHRTITYKEDYGGLSAEERLRLIGNDGFYIDKEFVKGKMIIFLDDIRITGSHEKVIKRMADKFQLTNQMNFLYYADLINKEIHPDIENQLNYAYVKDLLCLNKIIQNGNFLLNTRVVKYILNAPFEEFKNFIEYQSDRLVQTIYHQAIGNSYHQIADYQTNFNFIKQLLKNNL